jgi:two-component system response regulator
MTRTILLVEDDENDVFLLQHALKKTGVANPIRVANNGQQAIDYFKSAVKPGSNGEFPLPYLVLLDLKLPYVMGLDVLKWIRQQPELAPIVVILSASSEDADISMAYHLGANAYLVKPSQARQLDDIVHSIKEFWLTHNTPPSQPNPERVVTGLAQRCRQQVFAAPLTDSSAGSSSTRAWADSPRGQEIQPSYRGGTIASPIEDSVEQRIIDALKTSPQINSGEPS